MTGILAVPSNEKNATMLLAAGTALVAAAVSYAPPAETPVPPATAVAQEYVPPLGTDRGASLGPVPAADAPPAAPKPALPAWLMTAIVLLVVPFAQGATLSKMFRERSTVSYRSTGLKMSLNGLFGSVAPFPANLLYWANFTFEAAILASNVFVDWKTAMGGWQPRTPAAQALEYILLSRHVCFVRYVGKRPVLLSKGMESALEYSLDEMLRYYTVHEELATLFYKTPEDLALVRSSLAELDHGKGYQRVFFPTTKGGVRKAMLFTSYPIVYSGRSALHRLVFGARSVIGSNRLAVDFSFLFPKDALGNVVGFVPKPLLAKQAETGA